MRHEVIENLVLSTMPIKSNINEWNLQELHKECLRILALDLPIEKWVKTEDVSTEPMIDKIIHSSDEMMERKFQEFDPSVVRALEKGVLLKVLDQSWKEHLQSLDFLKHATDLRRYGQRDPLNEYKREAFLLFSEMLARVREQVTVILTHAQQLAFHPVKEVETPEGEKINFSKIGRNELCPCGSGKKFKHCHGAIA